MILTDYHSHTPRCCHATGEMAAYIERAMALGLSEFGISDHSPWMVQQTGHPLAMRWEELPQYVRDVQAMQERYRRGGDRPFCVRLGMEADFVPTRVEIARETIAQYPWDYVIGSVHHLGLWGVPNPPESTQFEHYRIEDVCDVYFEYLASMIRARLVDIVGHLDLPKRFNQRPQGGMLRWVEPLIPLLRANDMTVEINTSGLEHPCRETYPSWDLIEALAAGGVNLTICSDSHRPEDVGRFFRPTLERLTALGITHLTRYEQRQPIAYPIPPTEELALLPRQLEHPH